MGTLVKTLFHVRGKVGDVTFRNCRGNVIVQSVSTSRVIRSQLLMKTITKFGRLQSLYKAICNTKDLTTLWKKETETGKPVNSFFTKVNYKYLNDINKKEIHLVLVTLTDKNLPVRTSQMMKFTIGD